MRVLRLWLPVVLTLGACVSYPPPPPPPAGPPPFIQAAISDPQRPAEDRARDSQRLPGELIEFSGLVPGWKVADLIPGDGYYTRLLSKAVGPMGEVYAYVPDELTRLANRAPAVASFIGTAGYENTRLVLRNLPQFSAPTALDMVFIGQNYHSMASGLTLGLSLDAAVNAAVYRSLKPGGIYLIVDYRAQSGSGLRDAASLGRIDPDLVRREVTAAGFIFDGESSILRNPSDNLSLSFRDESLRGTPDQFVYRFRKPFGPAPRG